MRFLLNVLAGLAALAVVALVVGPRFVDWNSFKPEVAALAERATGRPLAIDGDIAFSLLPSPTLSAMGVRLGNPSGAAEPELMRLKALDARIAFLPLLAGRIVVESIALVEPTLVLDAGAGANGWDAGLDNRPRFDRIIVVDGSVLVRAGDTILRLERINAEIVANPPPGPLRVSGDVAWQGLSWRFELTTGRLGAAAPLNLTLGLRGGGANLRVTGTATPGAGQTLLAGRVRADTTRLPALLAALGVTGGLPAPLGQAATLEAGLEVTRSRLALNDVTLTLGDDMRAGGAIGLSFAAPPAFDVTLAVNRLEVERWMARLPPVAGVAAPSAASGSVLRGAVDLTIDAVLWRGGVLRQVRLNGALGDAGLTIRQAGAQLPGGSDVALFGHLAFGAAPRFDGHLEGGADNLRSLFDWLQIDLGAIPPDRLRRVSVIAGVSFTADRLELANIDLQFDASRLTGSVVAALGARPALCANLQLDRLNLEAYLPRAGAAARAGPPREPPPEPFAWLTALDANLQLHVDQLSWDTLPMRTVVANLTLERGTVSLHELSAESIAGVRATLGGVVRRARWPAETELTLTAQASDPSRFLQLLGWDAATPALGPLALSLAATGPLDRLHLALEAELAGGTLGAAAEADLATPGGAARGAVTMRHPETLRLLRALVPSYRPSAEGIGALSLAATLSATAGQLELTDGTLALGPARIAARAAADLANPRLGVTVTLSAPALVLDPLLSRRLAARPSAPLGPDLWALLAGAPAALAGFAALDADATIELGALDYQRHSATNLRLELGLRERAVTLTRLSAAAWDGRVELSGALAPALALKLGLSDVAIGPAADALLGLPGLDGKLGLTLDLTAGAAADGELAKSLAGSGRAMLRAGSLPGFDLEALNGLLERSAAGNAGDLPRAVEQDLARGRSAFTTLAGGLSVRGAAIATDDAAMTGEAGTVALGGALDLAARALDLKLALQLAGDRSAPPARL
ncbi:MAG: AsmA family protein, partial [Proteobacteria bacterium]|nr:AsmA family protein [Pseudomonadota bacterium]